ncbi:MAG: response regulator, partial [Victivallaceae bacterium]
MDWQKEQQLYFDSTSTTEMMQIPVLVNGVIKGFLMLVQSTSTLFPSGFHRLLQNAVHLIEAMLERELLLAEIRIQEEKTTVNKSNFERTLAEIEGLSQRKSHFLADFCHSLIARLNYLCSRFDDRQNTAAELLANLSRLEYIASLDAGDIPFQPEATASESFFNTIAASFQTDADQKKITLSLQIQPEIPDLWLDTVQTRRVLNSLLNHALSDTEQGWIELSIRFHHCGQDSGTLLMAVRDTGFGIDTERQKRIFDPDGGDLERVLCDRAIRLMGGCIELQSNPGKGSCVTVTLPVKRVTTATVQNNRLPVGDNRQESILIVDDIALNLKLLAAMLHKLGFKVHSADSGESALELLRNATPSAIFSDLWMPEMNGAELAKNIR